MEIVRVQSLASGPLKELPPQFIRLANERPENTNAVESVTVPVISLSLPHDLLVKQIAEAASEWGIFLMTNHGISQTLICRLQEVGQQFFALPQKEKEAYANDPSTGTFEGYGTRMTKNLDQKAEWIDYYFHIMSPSFKVNYDMWPKNPPSYREVTEEYNKEMLRLTDKVLGLLSEGLGLEGKALKSSLGDEMMEMEGFWDVEGFWVHLFRTLARSYSCRLFL